MAPNSKLIQSKWTVRGRLICWSCCLDECCRGRGWLGTEACVALPTAWGYEAGIFFFLLFSRPGPDLWQHQLFLRWQVRGRVATWGWHPLRRWKWGPSDLGQNVSVRIDGTIWEGGWWGLWILCVYEERTSHKKKNTPQQPPHFQLLAQPCVFLCVSSINWIPHQKVPPAYSFRLFFYTKTTLLIGCLQS